MTQYRKILIVKPSSLGDVVHSLALLNVIRNCFPEAAIHWVISGGLADLLQDHPMIDRLWTIDKESWKKITGKLKAFKELRTLSKKLKAEKFDLVIDLQGLFRSGLISWFTHAPSILGFTEAREGSRFFYSQLIEGGKNVHAVDRYLKVARFLGCNTSKVIFPFARNNDMNALRKKFSLPDRYAVIVPGARWKTKRWPMEKFGRVASGLPLRSVILGSLSDKEISSEISKISNGKTISLTGETSLKELVTIIKHAHFMLTNDTGPMHIAAALSIPVYAIFGPTSDLLTGPYGTIHTIFKSDLACMPCFKKTCNHIRCMENISADLVLKRIREDIE